MLVTMLVVPSKYRSSVAVAVGIAIAIATTPPSAISAQTPANTLTDTPNDTLRLTLAQVRERALQANPELRASQLDTAIARGELRQSGVLPFNPSFEVLGPGGGNATQPAISQELEVFGQRGVRMTAARAGYARATAEVANARRLTLGEVDRAFYRLVSAERRAQLADEVLSLNQRLSTVTQRQLAEGEISRLDFNLATVEVGRSRSRALAAHREQEEQAIELSRLIGLPRGRAIAPVLDSSEHAPAPTSTTTVTPSAIPGDTVRLSERALTLDVDSLTASALSRRPDLAASAAAAREASARASLSRREALPNFVVRGVWQRSAGEAQGRLSPGIGITLPFFNRNQGATQAREAAATQAKLMRAALTTRVRAQVASAVGAYRSAAQEVEVLESTVLAPARQNRQLLETAYREGKVGLPVLILIRNQVSDAELEYWTAWLAEREALANLAEVTGQNTTQNTTQSSSTQSNSTQNTTRLNSPGTDR